jgi:hypothetical protein
LLNYRSRKVLATSADAADSSVRHASTNTHTIISGVQSDVVNAPAVVSDSHRNRNLLKSPEDTCSQNRMVSAIRTLPVAEQPLKIIQSHARSAISARNETDI